eukprot:12828402-Alexandrium_andersonii.AAC.1
MRGASDRSTGALPRPRRAWAQKAGCSHPSARITRACACSCPRQWVRSCRAIVLPGARAP